MINEKNSSSQNLLKVTAPFTATLMSEEIKTHGSQNKTSPQLY